MFMKKEVFFSLVRPIPFPLTVSQSNLFNISCKNLHRNMTQCKNGFINDQRCNAKCFHWSTQCDCMLADRQLCTGETMHDTVNTHTQTHAHTHHLCFCPESNLFLSSAQSVEPQPFLCLKLFLFLWRELVSFHTVGTRSDMYIQNIRTRKYTWKLTWSIPKYPYYQNTTFEDRYKQWVNGYKGICLSFSLLHCLNIFVLTSRLIDGAVTFSLLHCCSIILFCATLMYMNLTRCTSWPPV